MIGNVTRLLLEYREELGDWDILTLLASNHLKDVTTPEHAVVKHVIVKPDPKDKT